jgi:hypothetical protein
MKKFRIFAICAILLNALFISSCEGTSGGSKQKAFDYRLQGTWVTNQTGNYSGKLKIGYETITIEGYEEDWVSIVLEGDDSKRPFRDFPKNVALKGYSEEGKIFINYGGGLEGIPYIYTEATYPQKYELLEFTFGGRKEFLRLAD